MPREIFEQHLQTLQESLLSMGMQVDALIGRSIQALANRDVVLAREVIATDAAINRAQREIEEQSLILIATQQPLAGDLRIIMTIANIAAELERMADHAEGIAKITLRIADQPLVKPLVDVPRMGDLARTMLREQLAAFIRRDAEAARRSSAQDREMDQLYDQVFRDLLIYMMNDPRIIARATYLLWVAHNLERIADRTTNIGERIVFLQTGQAEDLNPKRPEPG